jgi:hypothetical protein
MAGPVPAIGFLGIRRNHLEARRPTRTARNLRTRLAPRAFDSVLFSLTGITRGVAIALSR